MFEVVGRVRGVDSAVHASPWQTPGPQEAVDCRDSIYQGLCAEHDGGYHRESPHLRARLQRSFS